MIKDQSVLPSVQISVSNLNLYKEELDAFLALFGGVRDSFLNTDFSSKNIAGHVLGDKNESYIKRATRTLDWGRDPQYTGLIAFAYLTQEPALEGFCASELEGYRTYERHQKLHACLTDRNNDMQIEPKQANWERDLAIQILSDETYNLPSKPTSQETIDTFTRIIKRHHTLLIGEWTNLLQDRIEREQREEKSFDASKKLLPKRNSTFWRNGFLGNASRSQTSFYAMNSNDPLEAYQAVVYQIGKDLITSPFSFLRRYKKENGEEDFAYSIPFIALTPDQIRAVETFGKTKFGKKCLSRTGPQKLDEEVPTLFTLGIPVCNRKRYRYSDDVRLPSVLSLYTNCLMNEYWHNFMLDPRFAALCHFFVLPEDMLLGTKAFIVFGSHDRATLEKINNLFDFYKQGKNNERVATVFLAHELKYYMPNHSPAEVMTLVAQISAHLENSKDDKIIYLFEQNPEAAIALLSLKKYQKRYAMSRASIGTPSFQYTEENPMAGSLDFTEAFFKANEREIVSMRFGSKALAHREELQGTIGEIIQSVAKIRAYSWAYRTIKDLEEEFPKPKPEPAPKEKTHTIDYTI